MLRSFVRQIHLAITDFDFYATIFQQPFRFTLVFYLLISGLVAAFLTLLYAVFYFPEVDRFADWSESNLPAFSVTQNELRVEADQPYIVEFKNGIDWTFAFDTTGTYKDPSGLSQPALLFARKNLYLRVNDQNQTYSWADFGEFNFSPSDAEQYVSIFKWAYFPVAYSFLLVSNLIAKAFQALILAPLAYSVGVTYGTRMSLVNCLTITLYSLVPAIAIDLGVRMTGLEISYFDFIYLAIAGIYTFFATQRAALAH